MNIDVKRYAYPLVSVVIPVYNAGQTLPECFRCLSSQTIANDMEFIFVDDGSSDDSLNLIEKFSKSLSSVVVIHKDNGGVSSARNAGLAASRGEYVGFVDADDSFSPKMFETLLSAAEKFDSEISIIGFRIQMGGRWYKRYGTAETHQFNRTQALDSFLCEKLIDASVCSKLFKKSILSKLKFDKSLAYGEDRRFVFDALLESQSVVHTDVCLYDYRSNPGSAMRTGFDKRRIQLLDSVADMRRIVHKVAPDLDEQAACYELRCCTKTYEELLIGGGVAIGSDADADRLASYLRNFDYKMAGRHMLPRHRLASWLLGSFPVLYIALVRWLKYNKAKGVDSE